MSDGDISDEDDADWVAAVRMRVEDYLTRENVDHFGVAEWPEFYVSPYLALWSVQSKAAPGKVGWWVISGDVPTDYITSCNAKSPRAALFEIIALWTKASNEMIQGKQSPDYKLGNPKDWPKLGELLRKRVDILQSFASDDEFWADI